MTRPRKRKADREAGFTLVDSLVAVATLSAMTALLPQAIVTARQLSAETGSLIGARLAADSLLADIARDDTRTGRRVGTVDGHNWRADTQIREAGVAEGDEALYSTRLVVEISGQRTIVIERLTFGAVE